MLSNEVVIVAAKRTAIGNFNGCFASLSAKSLGEVAIRAVLDDSGIKADEVSEVIFGQILTANCGQNPARQAALAAGIPYHVPAWLVNQVCGSGLKSVALGMQAILSGDSKIVIAGGQESMSQSPHATYLRPGVKMGGAELVDTMIRDGLWDVYGNYHMGITAENVARKYGITRLMQDEFACASQNKTEAAQRAGAFISQIAAVTIPNKKGDIVVSVDEFPRAGTDMDSLAKLRPAFDKDGTVTAGNASGINDGAAAVLLMTATEAKSRGLNPLARIVSYGQSGVDPAIMGVGPVTASNIALSKAGWGVQDLDVIEANEAFAAQSIAVNRDMGWDVAKVNISGGAIALGHPIGASGTRILVTLLHNMQQNKAVKGLATLCIGGGMGIALCVEKY